MTQAASVKDQVEVGQVPRRSNPIFLTNEDYEADLSDRAIHWTGSGTTAGTLTLPSVSRAAGMLLSITVHLADTAQLAVQDQDDSHDWADLDMDTNHDKVLLYSDGVSWWRLENDIAA